MTAICKPSFTPISRFMDRLFIYRHTMNFNREKFFNGVRAFLKSNNQTLTQKRVDALEFLISSFEKTRWSIPQIAYAFATIFHETAGTFEPIKEYRAKAGSKGRANQDRYWLSGYYGRGYVQLTWKRNYELFGIAANPDKALEPETAFHVLTQGMSKGLFTGLKLSDYISDTGKDYKNARKIINGLDKAQLIAGYANQFEDILRASKDSARVPQEAATNKEAVSTPLEPSDQLAPINSEAPQETKLTEETQTGAKTVTASVTTPAGDAPDVEPTQVSQNGPLAKWIAGGGGLTAIGTFVWGYIQANPSAVGIAVVCLTLLIIAIIFRGAITDAIRMQTAADPNKKNVS